MIMTDIRQFLEYWDRVRFRTRRVIACVTPSTWSGASRKADLPWAIWFGIWLESSAICSSNARCSDRFATPATDASWLAVTSRCSSIFDRLNDESVKLLCSLTSADLQRKVATPDGTPITTWKWLRSMVEHEIHHRGQIYLYLAVLGVPTPPLYGLTEEQVLARSEAEEVGTVREDPAV